MVTLVTAAARFVDPAFIDIEYWLGARITHTYDAATWVVGLFLHLSMGGLSAIAYAFVFERVTRRAGISRGASVGLVHGVIVGALWVSVSGIQLAATPWASLGALLSVVAFSATLHMFYGSIVGAVYGRVDAVLPRTHLEIPAGRSYGSATLRRNDPLRA
jgi:hypothetical protein